MAYTADEYRNQLRQLLPPGFAIPADVESNAYKLLDGLAQELARLDARADPGLTGEANPASTLELLPDWERVAGLPDKCSNPDPTVTARRQALLAKLRATGGQSREYYISVAAALGYTITITEFRPFRAGLSVAGDALTNGDWIYVWRINAPESTIVDFRAGQNQAGDPLRDWGNEALECWMGELKPAHTILLFGYS